MPSFLGEPPSGPEVVSSPHPELEDPFAAMEREVQSALPSGFGFGSSTGDMFSGVRCECSFTRLGKVSKLFQADEITRS